MANLTQKYIDIVKDRYPNEPEFLQTVEEVLTSIEPVVEAHPEYIESGLMDRIIEPERMIQFRVPWMDDEGKAEARVVPTSILPASPTTRSCVSARAS